MSEEAEKIKRLVAFKKKLESKVEQLESELKELQALLETINTVLLEKGFKRAEIAKGAPAVEPQVTEAELKGEAEPENVIPLKTFDNVLLANLYVDENLLRVVPTEERRFNVNTPPFLQFLVEKVFLKMQEKDSELAKAGQLPYDKIFSYNIIRDGDMIQEIVIKNFDETRLRELKSSIRWTLEKMYEKMKT